MEIKTKFDVGQTIFVIRTFGRVEPAEVVYLIIYSSTSITCVLSHGGGDAFDENSNLIFETEDEAKRESIRRHIESLNK